MKKLLILFVITFIFVVGCTDNIMEEEEVSFSPPSWIIGVWVSEKLVFYSNDRLKYTFTSDDVVREYKGEISSFKDIFTGTKLFVNPSNDSEYKITVVGGLNQGVYHFLKTSTNTLNYTYTGLRGDTGLIKFNKQP